MKQIIIDSIELLNTCIECQSGGKDTRYYLRGVFFNAGRMTSTNGHILASFPIDLPELPEKGAIIPFPKPYPRTVKSVVIQLSEDTTNARIIAYKGAGVVQSDVNVNVIDGVVYPQWKNLVAKEFVPASEHRQRFNPDLLFKLTRHVASQGSMPVVHFGDHGMHKIEHDSFPDDSHALLMGARLD